MWHTTAGSNGSPPEISHPSSKAAYQVLLPLAPGRAGSHLLRRRSTASIQYWDNPFTEHRAIVLEEAAVGWTSHETEQDKTLFALRPGYIVSVQRSGGVSRRPARSLFLCPRFDVNQRLARH